MRFNCSYSKLVDINTLVPNPRNPNKHPDKQIDMLAKIIDFQGQRSPIVVSERSGFIVKGHGRLDAIKKLGWTQVAIDVQAYDTEAQEYADLIADNKIAELADHDDMLMLDELKKLEGQIDDFELFGLDNFSFDTEEETPEDDSDDKYGTGLDKFKIKVTAEQRQAIERAMRIAGAMAERAGEPVSDGHNLERVCQIVVTQYGQSYPD